MAIVTLQGNKFHTNGELPKVGSEAPDFTLVNGDLSDMKSEDLKGKRIVLNIFPSLDTSVCATSLRKFNTMATQMGNTVILGISKDLPFAQGRFCSSEGIENVIALSAFRSPDFAKKYGVEIIDGPLSGLFARAIVVIDENGKIIYEELVPEITHEPNYDAVLNILK